MKPSITHDRDQEALLAKARWFQSLSLEERMDYLCAVTDLILEDNPGILTEPDLHPVSGRVRVLVLPPVDTHQ
jgi:hypothetical protein